MNQSAPKNRAGQTILGSSCPLVSATSKKNDGNSRAELLANANNEPMQPSTVEPKEVSSISHNSSNDGKFLSREVKNELLSGEGENAAPVSTARGSTASAEAASIDLTNESNKNESEKQTAANRSNTASESRLTYGAEDDFIGDHGIFDENLPPLQMLSPTQFFSGVSSPLTNPTSFSNNNNNESTDKVTEPPVTNRQKIVSKEKVNRAKKTKRKTEGEPAEGAKPTSTSDAKLTRKKKKKKSKKPYAVPEGQFTVIDGEVSLSIPIEPKPKQQTAENFDSFENGEDTDGEIGPFYDAVAEEEDFDDDDMSFFSPFRMEPQDNLLPVPDDSVQEDSMLEGSPRSATEAVPEIAAENPVVAFTEDDLKKMKNSELQAELKKRGRSTNGNKTVLVARLLAAINDEAGTSTGRNRSGRRKGRRKGHPRTDEAIEGFALEARWRELVANNEPVAEPTRPNDLVGPTIPLGEKEFKKFDYADQWDREPWTATSPVHVLNASGKKKMRNGQPVIENELREKGRVSQDWLNKHKLTERSTRKPCG